MKKPLDKPFSSWYTYNRTKQKSPLTTTTKQGAQPERKYRLQEQNTTLPRRKEEEMTNTELNATIRNLKDLRSMVEELQQEISATEDIIKAEMTAREADEITSYDEVAGFAHKIRWQFITSSRLDTTALKKALPDIAERFTKTTGSRRFTVA